MIGKGSDEEKLMKLQSAGGKAGGGGEPDIGVSRLITAETSQTPRTGVNGWGPPLLCPPKDSQHFNKWRLPLIFLITD